MYLLQCTFRAFSSDSSKKEYLEITPEQLSKFDVKNKAFWVNHSSVDVGMGAESVLKVNLI